jgi:hypothetical protein
MKRKAITCGFVLVMDFRPGDTVPVHCKWKEHDEPANGVALSATDEHSYANRVFDEHELSERIEALSDYHLSRMARCGLR